MQLRDNFFIEMRVDVISLTLSEGGQPVTVLNDVDLSKIKAKIEEINVLRIHLIA